MNTIHKLCECGCGQEVANEKNRFINGHSRKGKKHSIDSQLKMSKSHIGKKLLPKTIEKIVKKNTGKKRSEKTKLKISENNVGMLAKHHSIETKLKISLSCKKYIEENGIDSVFKGRNEKYILSIISDFTGLEILRNDRNISQRIKGKSCDGYLPKHNLVTEVLEKHHFKSNGELSDYDQERQLKIARDLVCMIYYIPEQEFLKNTEKEIQRLNDFIILLDQGKN
jgi:hypothetical protein